MNDDGTAPLPSRRSPSRCPASSPATRRSARSGARGNDLHYRGYDILDIADACEFEEIAYLLVHGKLPNVAELARTRTKLEVAARPAESGAGGRSSAARRPRIRWT